MSDRKSGLHMVLSNPMVYRIFANLVGGTRASNWIVEEQVRARSGEYVLDIGCGPGSIIDVLPAVRYTGFDSSEAYIDEARRRYGDRGRFFHGSVTEPPSIDPGSFDIVLALGVLHHLDGEEATALLTLAWQVLRKGGRLVTWDPCFVEGQSRVARFFLRRDRGRFIRPREGYEDLARQVFDEVEGVVHHDLLRIPYTHLILQCTRT